MNGSTFIYDIKSQLDIKDSFELCFPGQALTRHGRYWWTCCPVHSEKHPSFCLDTSKQRFTCYGCHVHGDAIDLYALRHGLSNRQAIVQLAERMGIKGRERRKPTPAELAEHQWQARKKAIDQAMQRSVEKARLECWEIEGWLYTVIKHIRTERDLERPGPIWALSNLSYIEYLGDLFLQGPAEQLYALWALRRWKERHNNGTRQ